MHYNYSVWYTITGIDCKSEIMTGQYIYIYPF